MKSTFYFSNLVLEVLTQKFDKIYILFYKFCSISIPYLSLEMFSVFKQILLGIVAKRNNI